MKVAWLPELNFTSTAADLAPPSAPSSRSASEQSLNPLSTNSLDLDGQETTSVLNLSQSVLMNPLKLNLSHLIKNQAREKVAVGESIRKAKLDQLLKVMWSLKRSKLQKHLKLLKKRRAEEKSYALEVFESTINREVFLTTTEHNVREIWLKRKIRLLRTSDAWPQNMM